MSSAAVVAVMRRLTGMRRIGHAGTLDPEAAGVLPLMTGKATRLFDYLTDKEKEYTAVCAFGSATDTQDATGIVTETGDNWPNLENVKEAAAKLTGDIIQKPSIYSAIKVGGKPLYLRARRGETADVPERMVRIDRISIIRETEDHGFEISVQCGRGTYIRTLCADLGKLCGCPAHMRSLTRTRSGVFRIEDAISLEKATELHENGKLFDYLLPPDYAIGHLPRTDVPVKLEKLVANGAKLPLTPGTDILAEGEPVRIYLKDEFWGIASRQNNQLVWKAQIMPENRPEEMK